MATVAYAASVIEGVSRDRNALLNGEVGSYDWDSGYTCHQLGNGAIVIQLNQPYQISTMRYIKGVARNQSGDFLLCSLGITIDLFNYVSEIIASSGNS